MTEQIHVVGIGASTPLGGCARATAAAQRAGISRFASHPYVLDSTGELMTVARNPFVSSELEGAERYEAMILPALAEAMAPLERLPAMSIPLLLGLPPQRPGRPADLESRLERSLYAWSGPAGRIQSISALPWGHASGLLGMGDALAMIQSGRSSFCLVGGVDTYLAAETLEWLDAKDQVHGAGELKNAFGFIPGEGAGCCLLASETALRRHGLGSMARVLSVGSAQEKNLIHTSDVCTGEGLSLAIRGALQAVPEGRQIDQLICDQNGEIYRADEFGFTLARTGKRFAGGGVFMAPAECWGDVGAASGPLFATLAIVAGSRGYAKGPLSLLSASSEGGRRAAVILEADLKKGRV